MSEGLFGRASLCGTGSSSSRGALPNVFLEKLFFSKKQRSRSRFDEATICGFTKTASAPLEEPIVIKEPCQTLPKLD